MLTQAEIKQVITRNNLSGSSEETGVYLVHIPLFDTVTKINTLVYAHALYNDAGYGSYEVGDLVWVGFEKNEAGKPVILGRMYQGRELATLKNKYKSQVTGKDLDIKEKASLPYDTLFKDKTFASLNTDVINLNEKVEKLLPLVELQNADTMDTEQRYIRTKNIKYSAEKTFYNNVKSTQAEVYTYNLLIPSQQVFTRMSVAALSSYSPNYKLPNGDLIIHNINAYCLLTESNQSRHLNISPYIYIQTVGYGKSKTNDIFFDTIRFCEDFDISSQFSITLDYLSLNIEYSNITKK